MNGRTPQEAAGMDLYFIDAIGLGENLSPTRSNGLRAMVAQMKLDALVFTQTENQ
jgi:cysteine desulfuration protein SufE